MISMRLRHNLSPHHIQAADYFAQQSGAIETEHAGKTPAELAAEEEAHAKYRAYVTGTIFDAVAFLEATINELFSDAADNPGASTIEKLDPTVKSQLDGWWKFGVQ